MNNRVEVRLLIWFLPFP
uniref:Uncharacterized protein n=1 Tax=Arundo donax TaxID=35708 RepID=A0A0A9GBH8_ARUDO